MKNSVWAFGFLLLFCGLALAQGQDAGSSPGSAPSGSQAKDNSAQSDTAQNGDNSQRKSKAQDALQAQIDELNAVLQKLQEAQKSAQQVYQAQQQGISPEQVPGLLEQEKRLIETKLQRGLHFNETHTQPIMPPIDSRIQPISPQELLKIPSIVPMPISKDSKSSFPEKPNQSHSAGQNYSANSFGASSVSPTQSSPSPSNSSTAPFSQTVPQNYSASDSKAYQTAQTALHILQRHDLIDQLTRLWKDQDKGFVALYNRCQSFFPALLPLDISWERNDRKRVELLETKAELELCSNNQSTPKGSGTSSDPHALLPSEKMLPSYLQGERLCLKACQEIVVPLQELYNEVTTARPFKNLSMITNGKDLPELLKEANKLQQALPQTIHQLDTLIKTMPAGHGESSFKTLCAQFGEAARPSTGSLFDSLSDTVRESLYEQFLTLLQSKNLLGDCQHFLSLSPTKGNSFSSYGTSFASHFQMLQEALAKTRTQNLQALSQDVLQALLPQLENVETFFQNPNSPWQCIVKTSQTDKSLCPALQSLFPSPELLEPILTHECLPVQTDPPPLVTHGPSCSPADPCNLWKILKADDPKSGGLDLSKLKDSLTQWIPAGLLSPSDLSALSDHLDAFQKTLSDIQTLLPIKQSIQALETLQKTLTQHPQFLEGFTKIHNTLDSIAEAKGIQYELLLEKLQSLPENPNPKPSDTSSDNTRECLTYLAKYLHESVRFLSPQKLEDIHKEVFTHAPESQKNTLLKAIETKPLVPLQTRLTLEFGLLLETTYQYLIQTPQQISYDYPHGARVQGNLNPAVLMDLVSPITPSETTDVQAFVPNLVYNLGNLYRTLQTYLNALACLTQQSSPSKNFPATLDEVFQPLLTDGKLLFFWNTPAHQAVSIPWVVTLLRVLQCLPAQGSFASSCNADGFFTDIPPVHQNILQTEFAPLQNKQGAIDNQGKPIPSSLLQKLKAILTSDPSWTTYLQKAYPDESPDGAAEALIPALLFSQPFTTPRETELLQSLSGGGWNPSLGTSTKPSILKLADWPEVLQLWNAQQPNFLLSGFLQQTPLEPSMKTAFSSPQGWTFQSFLNSSQCPSLLSFLDKKTTAQALPQDPSSLSQDIQTLYPQPVKLLSDSALQSMFSSLEGNPTLLPQSCPAHTFSNDLFLLSQSSAHSSDPNLKEDQNVQEAASMLPQLQTLLKALKNDWETVSQSPLYQSFLQGTYPDFGKGEDPNPQLMFATFAGPTKVKILISVLDDIVHNPQYQSQSCLPLKNNCFITTQTDTAYGAILGALLYTGYLFQHSILTQGKKTHFLTPAVGKRAMDFLLERAGGYDILVQGQQPMDFTCYFVPLGE